MNHNLLDGAGTISVDPPPQSKGGAETMAAWLHETSTSITAAVAFVAILSAGSELYCTIFLAGAQLIRM